MMELTKVIPTETLRSKFCAFEAGCLSRTTLLESWPVHLKSLVLQFCAQRRKGENARLNGVPVALGICRNSLKRRKASS